MYLTCLSGRTNGPKQKDSLQEYMTEWETQPTPCAARPPPVFVAAHGPARALQPNRRLACVPCPNPSPPRAFNSGRHPLPCPLPPLP